MSDLGGGEFDGAHLVSNFELLEIRAATSSSKTTIIFAAPERSAKELPRARKWGAASIFINDGRDPLDCRAAVHRQQARAGRASWGDNITPPQQALNWIVDTYADEQEIKIRGQRIIYLVHDKVGHLGIFVSSSIAKKEHTEVSSTMKTIEALAPGLYEMTIDDQEGEGLDAHFQVSFHERKLTDVLAIDENDRSDERDFAAVERFSELATELYELGVRPLVQSMVTPQVVEYLRRSHPSRLFFFFFFIFFIFFFFYLSLFHARCSATPIH